MGSRETLLVESSRSALAPEPTYFLLRGLGEESEEPGTSEILPGKQPAMWARGGGGSAQSQGRGVPGSAGPGRSILAQAPAALGPGRALPCARPRSSLSTRSSPGFPRVPRLPAGRAGAMKLRAASRGRGGSPNRGGILLPLSLRRPPVAASPLGPRVFLLSAPDADQSVPGPRPKFCAGRSRTRSTFREVARTPESRPLVSAGASGYPTPPPGPHLPPPPGPPPLPLLPGSAPRPPPSLAAAAAAAAAAGGRGREAAPRARCVSWALRLLPGAGRTQVSLHCSAAPGCQNLLRGSGRFFRVERLVESQES